MKSLQMLCAGALVVMLTGCQTTTLPDDRRATVQEINDIEAKCHVIQEQAREMKLHREEYKNAEAEYEPDEQKWREAFDTKIKHMLSECRMSSGSIRR